MTDAVQQQNSKNDPSSTTVGHAIDTTSIGHASGGDVVAHNDKYALWKGIQLERPPFPPTVHLLHSSKDYTLQHGWKLYTAVIMSS
jgi:hypothetical protein